MGSYWDNGKDMETTMVYQGVYRGYLGILENKMETAKYSSYICLVSKSQQDDTEYMMLTPWSLLYGLGQPLPQSRVSKGTIVGMLMALNPKPLALHHEP